MVILEADTIWISDEHEIYCSFGTLIVYIFYKDSFTQMSISANFLSDLTTFNA